MKIIHLERVSLTEEEHKQLDAAYRLLMEIYGETKDDEICFYADRATDAIACLLDRCQF